MLVSVIAGRALRMDCGEQAMNVNLNLVVAEKCKKTVVYGLVKGLGLDSALPQISFALKYEKRM